MLYEYFGMKGDFEDATHIPNSHQNASTAISFLRWLKLLVDLGSLPGPNVVNFLWNCQVCGGCELCTDMCTHIQTHTNLLSFVFTLAPVQQQVKLLQIIAWGKPLLLNVWCCLILSACSFWKSSFLLLRIFFPYSAGFTCFPHKTRIFFWQFTCGRN